MPGLTLVLGVAVVTSYAAYVLVPMEVIFSLIFLSVLLVPDQGDT